MALFNKLKSLFGKKEKQSKHDEEMEFYKRFAEHRQAIEETNRDKFAIESMKNYLENGETALRKYHYAMPCTRDGKQGFAYLNFEHTYNSEIYRDGGEREFASPTYGRFVVKTEESFEVERLDEKQTMEVKQQIDIEQQQSPEL